MIKYLLLFLALTSNAFALEYIESELKCLADNIYFEARNESVKGQVAVALVTINRVNSIHFPNTVCDVVWQQGYSRKTKRKVAQFSWTLDGASDIPKEGNAYNRSMLVSSIILNSLYVNGDFPDFTNGATHYHATYVSPYWKSTLIHIAVIDNHIFYKFKK